MMTLESCRLFRQLAPGELKTLRQAAQERIFSADQEIFKEGDEGDGLYVVKKGLVRISALISQNVRHEFSQVAPGEIFGEMAVIENKPRSACATATEPTTVYFIPRADMLGLVEGSPSLAFGLLQEISNRLREFNQQYIQETLQSERLVVVGRFARSIVHDLKNPLNIIGLTAETMVLDNSTPESRRTARGRINQQVDRISDMINEILEFTQGVRTSIVPASTYYNAFVEHLLQEIRPEIELKSAVIELENQPPEIRLLLNPKRLRRVFYNLIHNATDAMPSGGRIILRFQVTDSEVITEIEDSGPGIAPEISDRLFDAFATYGKAHGTGLGLSICKKIIEDHDGRIFVRNEPGRGAIFCFALPVQKG